MIVPTLCVGMPPWTLRVPLPGCAGVAQSATGCIPTRSVGTIDGLCVGTIKCHQVVTFPLPFVTCPRLALV